MFRLCLPVAIAALAGGASAQSLSVPGLTPEVAPQVETCDNVPFDQVNCVRVLACYGSEGLFFDGQARGWDRGAVTGVISNGVTCVGSWDGDGPLGTGIAALTCSDGSTADVIYYNQDNETGTVIGQGRDSLGRDIKVWSGTNVLQFLMTDGRPALPCVQGAIPIS